MSDAITYNDVVDELLKHVPEFRDEVEEHREFHGELLPHVLFGDLTRFVLRAREEGQDELVQRALGFLDEALRRGDEQVDNLVSLSFVQNVEPWGPEYAAFIEEWPPALQDEAQRQRDWRPPSG